MGQAEIRKWIENMFFWNKRFCQFRWFDGDEPHQIRNDWILKLDMNERTKIQQLQITKLYVSSNCIGDIYRFITWMNVRTIRMWIHITVFRRQWTTTSAQTGHGSRAWRSWLRFSNEVCVAQMSPTIFSEAFVGTFDLNSFEELNFRATFER